MRPIALDVQGFTCFREAQPTLDLSSLSLFAITGPTGAGKSSVLDAVTFALYGKVPRMGRGSVKDLISHGRDRMSVTLRFMARDRTFVVTRMVRRGTGAGQCQLDETTGPTTMPLASGVAEVNEIVERLVGLDYDAFTQAVVLPQGEFARFLKGAPSQRRQILQDLLRLTIYNRMQKLAGERTRDARHDVAAAERQLGALADATPDSIARMEFELADAMHRHAGLVQARDRARARRVDAEARAQLARELDERRGELLALGKDADAQAARVERIARCHKARQVGAALEQFVRDRTLCETRLREHELATVRLAAARDGSASARARLAVAQTAVADLAPIRSTIEKLRALEGRLQHREALSEECRDLSTEASVLRHAVMAREAAIRTEMQALDRANADHTRLDAALAVASYDPAELDACEGGRDLARELRSLRQDEPAVEMRVRQSEAAVRESDRIAEADRDAIEAARASLARAETGRAEAVRRLTEAQDTHRAMTLRGHLHAGERCPVCEQDVAVVPPLSLPPELAALFDAQNEATDACRMLSERVTAIYERHVRSAAAAEGARAHLEALRQSLVVARGRAAASVATLANDLRRYLPASSASTPDQWLLQRLDDLNGLRAEREVRERQRQIVHAARLDADHRVALAQQALDTGRRDLAALEDRLTTRRATHDALHAEIVAITDAADPRAESTRLSRRVIDAEGLLDAARVEVMRQDTNLAGALEAEAAAARMLDEARGALDAIKARAARSLETHGFASAEAAEAALIDDTGLAALEHDSDLYTRRHTELTAYISDLESRFGSETVSEATLADCVSAEAQSDAAVTDNLRRSAQLEVQLLALRDRARHAVAVHGELTRAREIFEIHARLSADLKADVFQAWLLREAFERLVAGASSRLMELSGRYTMQWLGDEFVIVDHDNALERRAAETLSGGETFLASLALALELSEQVQRASGAVRLDSLFIDEGFGTLDAAAQDVVASAIESLQVSGRMVGIITHVRDLTDRMPACVVIEKHPDGSRWHLTPMA